MIEKWLQQKAAKLRYTNYHEIKTKTGSQLNYHSKNYFVETDLEKHIKWFSKVRGFDIMGAIITEIQDVKKEKMERLEKQRMTRLYGVDDM